MDKKILLVIAHPDDEILGVGGTIQKYISKSFLVDIFVLSKPGNARSKDESYRLINFKKVCLELGINNTYFEKFPDTSFDKIERLQIIKSIEKVLDKSKPSIIYTHFYNDLNIDHCITSKALLTVIRPYSKYNYVKKIYMFEVLSTTEQSIGKEVFVANHYENIEKYIDKKIQLFSIYNSELREFPHPRSKQGIYTLAQFRGMESGFNYAEAFILYRSINN